MAVQELTVKKNRSRTSPLPRPLERGDGGVEPDVGPERAGLLRVGVADLAESAARVVEPSGHGRLQPGDLSHHLLHDLADGAGRDALSCLDRRERLRSAAPDLSGT